MIIFGIILLAVGGGLLFSYFNNKKKLEEMTSVETSTAAALQSICNGVAEEIGGGSFEQKTEVNGIIECEQPLQSELAKQQCVYYRMSVTREWEEDYEETYTETDSEGREVQKTRRGTRKGSDTVSSNSRRTPFTVRDETGTILVDPEGANIDEERVVDRFEPQAAASGGNISFAGMTFSVGGLSNAGRRRTLGYRFQEYLLPLNRKVYILGLATDASGQLQIQKPREQGKFIISLKSEEELMASAQSGMKWSLYGSIACFVIGVMLVIIDLVK